MRERLAGILVSYKGGKVALVPILQRVQGEFGYISEEAVSEIARFTGLSASRIFGVLTFYAQFRTTPLGRNTVRICRGTACHVRGGARIIESVQRELGITEGETTANGEYTLETVACIGACALAPTMRINEDTYRRLTPQKVTEIFKPSEKGEKGAEES